ncbi:MAG: T9SS type A sorting domain-containing protein [Bacteroidales bacterium]|nr:T9SS type A sorting domain-containing protein [Bacteroidales bacterium]
MQVIAEDKSKVYDGEEFSGFTVIYEGFVADEDESVLSGTLKFGDEAEDAINAGTYTIQPEGLSSTNYNIGYTSATLTIEKAPLLVKADDKSKIYDGQVFDDFTVSYTGFVNIENEDVLSGELQFSGAANDAINVGSYTIIPFGLTATNYDIGFEEGTLDILKATLTITADDKSKVYDKQVFTGFTVQYSGFAEGEGQSVLTGSVQYSGDAPTEVNVGQYTITPEGLSAINYDIEYVSGTLTITPAALTITADNKTKVYDKQVFSAFTVSYEGFAGSDSESELQGTLSFSGDAFTAVNVGSWEIIPVGLESTNYNITYVNGSLEITPATLTVTADDKSKVYDTAIFTDFSASYSGFAGSDGPADLEGNLTYGGDAASAVNAGTYTIIPGGLSSDNYSITFNNGILNITEAALTIIAEDKSKDYDGQTFTDFTVVYDGFVGGEDETSLEGSLSFDGTAEGAVNAGVYEIIPQGYSSQNYDISYVSGELTISTVALTVTADNKSKPYDGQEFTDFTVSYAGFVAGENEEDLEGAPSFAGTAVGAINAGTYIIQPQGLTSGNYDISYVNGELTITSILLTVTADDQSKVYDGNPFTDFTVSYDGFIDGDDESDLGGTLEFEGDAVEEINVGSYTIIPSGYTSQNYEIVYENGTLTITTRPLTIAANDINKTVGVELEFDGTEFTATGLVNNGIDQVISVTLVSAGASADAEVGTYDIIPSNAQGIALENYSISYANGTLTVTDKIILALSGTVAEDKVYDGTTIATISDIGILIGVQPGDDVSIDTDLVIANFNNKNVDNNKLVTLSNIVLIGDDAVNYTIGNQFASASITPRPLTLFDFAAGDKPYDGTTNATGTNFSDDRVNGDVLSFSYNAAFESPDAGTGKTVNFSDIQISGGADANNYQLITTSGQATADITPVPLTITANDEQKVYDSQAFTGFSVAYSGFITGENASVLQGSIIFSGDALTAVDVGEYEIIPGGLSSNNYIITFVAGTLTITPAELTITADNKSKVYDTQTFDAFTVSYSGFEGGDGPTVLDGTLSFAGTAPDAVNAGEYSIIPQGLNSNNYTISFVNGILEITPALLTITADDKSKVYDGQVFTGFTVSYDGFAGNEGESVLQGTLNYIGTAVSAVNAGVFQIIPQGVSSGNYNIQFLPGELTITKAPLVITADDKSKTYNGQVFTAFTVSYSGFVNDETPGVLQGTLSYSGPATTAINAGQYTITPQGLTSVNYEIVFVNGLLTISKANLTVTASNKSKVYDGQVFTGFTALYSGFISGENPNNLQGTLSFSGSAITATNVGSYEIIPQGYTSNNYNITYVSGTLSITRASLSITADNKTKVYDGQIFTAFTVTYSGFVSGEGPANLQGSIEFSGPAVSAINTGAYLINAGGLTSGNYNISYSPGTLSITPASLTITADDKSKVYDGGVFQGFTVSYSGFVNGDGPSDLQGTLSFTGAGVNAVNVGSYIITPQGLSSPNYNISFVSGLLSITRAALTITADNQVKPVGVNLVFDGTEFNAEGLVENGVDVVVSVTLFSNGAPASAPVGDYPILASNAQGQGLSNYNISYVPGTLSVSDKILLTLEGLTVDNKVYDGTRTATVSDFGTLTGVQPGTDVQLDTSQATALFNTKNVGNNKPVTVSGLILTGDDAVMYTIGSQISQANITPRALTLSGFVANNKVYDGSTAATGGAFQDDRIEGDVLNFTFNYAFENANAGTNKQVLFTNIAISGGTDQNNYSLATTTGNATATISPRPLSIKADDKTKKFGENDPALTWTLTAGSLVSDDNITGQLQRQSGEAVGTYAIQQGTLTAGSNYSINFTPGVFSILPADLIVTIEPQAAVTAGAQWSIDGETWYNSQFALPLVPGEYTVEFSDIDTDAWYTPEPIDIVHGAQTEVTGTYVAKKFFTMLEPVGNGTVTPEAGTYDYPVGETVTLTASADEDWIFQHWLINGSTVTSNPYNLQITEDVTVQAVFNETLVEVLLSINISGEGIVNVNGNEFTQPMIFAEGSEITLEALAGAGYYFVEWQDDLTGNENPVTITMDDDKTITALFLPEDFTVTFIVKDENDQDITDAIITFDGTEYPAGQYLIENLTSGSYDWEVSREGYYTETGSVDVEGNEEVTVILESSTYELEIVHEGTGTTDPAEGIHLIEKNTMVTLTAQTSSVSIFIKWEIDGNEYFDEEIEILMDSDKVVTAFFENLPSYMLTVIVEGEGITEPEEGEHHYAYDEVVTLTATPENDNWVFAKWVVDNIDYFESEINVLMNSDKVAIAIFVDNVNYTLDIDFEGVGTINPAPGIYIYAAGTELTLSAQPGQNYIFDRWEINGVEFTDPVVTLIMNEDKVVRAFFDFENFIAEIFNERDVILYPVPAKDKLNLRFEIGVENARIEIYDINGRQIIIKDLSDVAAGQATIFNVSSFEPGVYNMKIIVKSNILTRRFIVK